MTTNDNDELWYVQMDNGELRELTLDELDEAFNAGLIHENTFVMEVGGTEWQTLADVAGLNDEEEPAPPAPVYAPQAVGPARPLPNLVPHQSQYPAPTSAAMSASAWPPVVAASGYAARPTPPSVAPFAIGPQSTAPVVHDLSDLDLNPPFKKRGMGLWVAAAAVIVLGGAGFAATQMKGGFSSLAQLTKDAPVAAAMTAPPAADPPRPVATTPPAPAKEPEPAKEEAKAEAKDEKKAEESGGKTKSMSEELKERLKAADETRTKDRKSKRAARASKASRRSSGKGKKGGSDPFSASGSSRDPLNGKL